MWQHTGICVKPLLMMFLYSSFVLGNQNIKKRDNCPAILEGIPDQILIVGKLFQYKIPENAFKLNDNTIIQISTPSQDQSLPQWINYREITREFIAVPTIHDGFGIYIKVTLLDQQDGCPNVSDVFHLEVKTWEQSNEHNQNGLKANLEEGQKKEKTCYKGVDLIQTTLIFAVNLQKLGALDRLDIVKKLANFLDINSTLITISTGNELFTIHDKSKSYSILASGHGNTVALVPNATELTWKVPCSVFQEVHLFIQVLQHNVEGGRLTSELGYDVVGWYISAMINPSKQHQSRKKRFIPRIEILTPTPRLELVPATKIDDQKKSERQWEIKPKHQRIEDLMTHQVTQQPVTPTKSQTIDLISSNERQWEIKTKDQGIEDLMTHLVTQQLVTPTKSQTIDLISSNERQWEIKTKDQRIEDLMTHLVTQQLVTPTKSQTIDLISSNERQWEIKTKDQGIEDLMTHQVTQQLVTSTKSQTIDLISSNERQWEIKTKDQRTEDLMTHQVTQQLVTPTKSRTIDLISSNERQWEIKTKDQRTEDLMTHQVTQQLVTPTKSQTIDLISSNERQWEIKTKDQRTEDLMTHQVTQQPVTPTKSQTIDLISSNERQWEIKTKHQRTEDLMTHQVTQQLVTSTKSQTIDLISSNERQWEIKTKDQRTEDLMTHQVTQQLVTPTKSQTIDLISSNERQWEIKTKDQRTEDLMTHQVTQQLVTPTKSQTIDLISSNERQWEIKTKDQGIEDLMTHQVTQQLVTSTKSQTNDLISSNERQWEIKTKDQGIEDLMTHQVTQQPVTPTKSQANDLISSNERQWEIKTKDQRIEDLMTHQVTQQPVTPTKSQTNDLISSNERQWEIKTKDQRTEDLMTHQVTQQLVTPTKSQTIDLISSNGRQWEIKTKDQRTEDLMTHQVAQQPVTPTKSQTNDLISSPAIHVSFSISSSDHFVPTRGFPQPSFFTTNSEKLFEGLYTTAAIKLLTPSHISSTSSYIESEMVYPTMSQYHIPGTTKSTEYPTSDSYGTSGSGDLAPIEEESIITVKKTTSLTTTEGPSTPTYTTPFIFATPSQSTEIPDNGKEIHHKPDMEDSGSGSGSGSGNDEDSETYIILQPSRTRPVPDSISSIRTMYTDESDTNTFYFEENENTILKVHRTSHQQHEVSSSTTSQSPGLGQPRFRYDSSLFMFVRILSTSELLYSSTSIPPYVQLSSSQKYGQSSKYAQLPYDKTHESSVSLQPSYSKEDQKTSQYLRPSYSNENENTILKVHRTSHQQHEVSSSTTSQSPDLGQPRFRYDSSLFMFVRILSTSELLYSSTSIPPYVQLSSSQKYSQSSKYAQLPYDKTHESSESLQPSYSKEDRETSQYLRPSYSKEDRKTSQNLQPSYSKEDRETSQYLRPSYSKEDQRSSQYLRPLYSKEDRQSTAVLPSSSSRKDHQSSWYLQPFSIEDHQSSSDLPPSSSKYYHSTQYLQPSHSREDRRPSSKYLHPSISQEMSFSSFYQPKTLTPSSTMFPIVIEDKTSSEHVTESLETPHRPVDSTKNCSLRGMCETVTKLVASSTWNIQDYFTIGYTYMTMQTTEPPEPISEVDSVTEQSKRRKPPRTTPVTTTTTKKNKTNKIITRKKQRKRPTNEPSTRKPKQHINKAPNVTNPIGKIYAAVGKMFEFQIPENTFHDVEDGSTRHLTLDIAFSWESRKPPSSSHIWVQFDETKQTFSGLPLSKDLKRSPMEVTINAIDQGGKIAQDVVMIYINSSATNVPSQEFVMKFDVNGKRFIAERKNLKNLIRKLSSYFGDKKSYITVLNARPGSLVLTWTNNSISTDKCDNDTIQEMKHKVVDDHGNINPKFDTFMLPKYKVEDVSFRTGGVCHAVSGVSDTGGIVDVDPWAEAIIPTVIAVAIAIFIVVIILLICSRKQQKQKNKQNEHRHSFEDQDPVMFHSERSLQDRAIRSKRAVILPGDGKPKSSGRRNYSPQISLPYQASTFDEPETLSDGEMKERGGSPYNDPLFQPPPPYRLPPPYYSDNGSSYV